MSNKEIKKEAIVVVELIFPNGKKFKQDLYLQDFKKNEAKKFRNKGYSLQSRYSDYKINLVIIDETKKENF